jgi:hypothetical protein
MAPRRIPLTREQAERQIREATAALQALEERDGWRGRVRATEPRGSEAVVRFRHRFVRNGKLYTYAAIRAENLRGDRRWFITSADYLPSGRGHQGLTSPATWVDLVEFAEPGTIERLTRGNRIDIPGVPVGDAPRVPLIQEWTDDEWFRRTPLDGLIYDDRSGD